MKLKLSERKIVLSIFILTLIVLLTPFFLRYFSGNTTLIGHESFLHLKLANHQDILFQSRFFTPYDLILFGLNKIIQTNLWSVILLAMLGVGTILLFNNFLRRFNITNEQRFFILFFLILSPAFIYTFVFSNQYSLIVFLLILTANLLNVRGPLKYSTIPILVVMPFFDILTSLITLGGLLVYWLLKKENVAFYLALGFLGLLIAVQIFFPQPFSYEPMLGHSFFGEFFSDLGGLKGLSLFHIFLAVVGLIATWKKRRIYYFVYPTIFILILVFALVNENLVIYLNFILAFFAGKGLVWLWERKWNLDSLKKLSILIILIGLLLSIGGYVNRISQSSPNDPIKESLLWLKDNSLPNEIVFSHESKSFWIEALAEREAFLDSFDQSYKNKLLIGNNILHSRDIKLTTQLLEENKIKHIWIDLEMVSGQVWKDEDEGLLFLFRNPRFKNIYNKKGIEIWEFN